MPKYYVDFSGYLTIEADTPASAEEKFWDLINTRMDLSVDYSDYTWDINGIEKAEPFFEKRYQVMFCDEVHDVEIAEFDNLGEALEFWDTYVDTPTCFAGQICDNGEVIYNLDKTEGDN